ncbi:hypothetical protein M0P48_02170 [Candidatus Gracilibacteria bacterium]|jgi:hypothetical protein|nr:hypothetical protein [Candidatus Gracilibacteria bacterium]
MENKFSKVWVFILVLLILAGGYFGFAKYKMLWPFSSEVTVENAWIEEEITADGTILTKPAVDEDTTLTTNPEKTTAVTPTTVPRVSQTSVNDFTTFNSKYFNLSFQIPADFEVNDGQNYIAVSKGKYERSDIGSDNAFFSLQRFDQYLTRNDSISYARKLLKNKVESTVTIDGSKFLQIEGDDYGRYEGDSAGKILQIFFDKSVLLVQERPGNDTQNFDVLAVAKQIISTIKFSSTAK